MKEKSFTKGVFYMLLSATGLAFTGFLGQIALRIMTLSSVIFWRFFLASTICLTLLWTMRKAKGIWHFSNLKMHALRASFVLTAQYSFYIYMEHNTLFNAIVLLNTGPIFIPIIEWGILRNKVGKSSWIGVIVSFIGMLLILQPNKEIFSSLSLIGLLAGVAQGASQVVFGINSKTERTDLSVFYLFLLCGGFAAFPYLFTHSTYLVDVHPLSYLLLFVLAIATVCNQVARAEAYQHSSPSGLSPFFYFSIILAGILDWAVYSVTPNLVSMIGAGLVVLGGLLKIYLRHWLLQKK